MVSEAEKKKREDLEQQRRAEEARIDALRKTNEALRLEQEQKKKDLAKKEEEEERKIRDLQRQEELLKLKVKERQKEMLELEKVKELKLKEKEKEIEDKKKIEKEKRRRGGILPRSQAQVNQKRVIQSPSQVPVILKVKLLSQKVRIPNMKENKRRNNPKSSQAQAQGNLPKRNHLQRNPLKNNHPLLGKLLRDEMINDQRLPKVTVLIRNAHPAVLAPRTVRSCETN